MGVISSQVNQDLAYAMRANGASYEQIARVFRITGKHAKKVVVRASARKGPLASLETRIMLGRLEQVERRKQIYRYFQQGRSRAWIAGAFGITRQRVGHIIHREQEHEQEG